MADIYRQARYVLIWAGRLSSALRGAATASARIPHLIGPRPGRVIRNESFQLLTILVKPGWKAALFDFCRHAYLTRTWIVQELHLAKEALLILDIGTVRINLVFFLLLVLETSVASLLSRADLPNVILHCRQHAQLGASYNRHNVLYNKSVQQKRDLFEYLLDFSMLECSDPRDRVYSLLGMTDQGDRIEVDYSRDKVQVLSHVLERTHGQSQKDFMFVAETIGPSLRLVNVLICRHSVLVRAKPQTQLSRPTPC